MRTSSPPVTDIAGGYPLGNPITEGTNYTDWLPSMNLIFGLPADQYVRFGAGRQMARPRMDDMRASDNVYVSQYDSGPCASGCRRRVAQFR